MSDPENNELDSDSRKGRVEYGPPGYYECWLVGDRSGFESLRENIDELLRCGEDVDFSGESFSSDFDGLSLNHESDSPDSSGDFDLTGVGCFIFLFLIGIILIFGIVKIGELFF